VSELRLTLRQPAQIGDRSREDFVHSTLDYIPGTVIRGAFAGAWLARNGVSEPGTPQREEFLRLFEGPVRFGALLRTGTEFAPLSLLVHKYPANHDCAVREYDRAVIDDVPPRCPQCHSPFEPQKPGLRGRGPGKKRRTSVSIGESGVARRGQLFTRESLQAGQDFTGTLVAGAADIGILGSLGPIRVGGRRTTHGLAEVVIREAAPVPAVEVHDGKLIIRLRSPGIFTDSHGRPIPEPDQAELVHVLGTEAKVERRWFRWEQVGGWHAASGLPKPAELAVAPGSTYVISTEEPVAKSRLAALELRGLGLRRHEGFGDLAPPPVLEAGRQERETERQRQRRLMDEIAPVRRLQVQPERWESLLAALRSYAAGDAGRLAGLRVFAQRQPDPDARDALLYILELPAEDAAFVVRELSSLWVGRVGRLVPYRSCILSWP
jgi:CRISPR-associated protein Csx10